MYVKYIIQEKYKFFLLYYALIKSQAYTITVFFKHFSFSDSCIGGGGGGGSVLPGFGAVLRG